LNFKIHHIILFPVFFINCSFFNEFGNSNLESINQKYFLGRSNTSNFQTTCEELLQYYGYYIDSYDNNNMSSTVSTKWKIRDPYKSEVDQGFLEVKIKIIIEGDIITDSYNKNNGYSYNTFLAYQNVGFKNNQYVFMNENEELHNHLEIIVTHFREKFNFQK